MSLVLHGWSVDTGAGAAGLWQSRQSSSPLLAWLIALAGFACDTGIGLRTSADWWQAEQVSLVLHGWSFLTGCVPDAEWHTRQSSRPLTVWLIALAGSDCDIDNVDYPIVANDSSVSSISFFVNEIVGAYKKNKIQKKV